MSHTEHQPGSLRELVATSIPDDPLVLLLDDPHVRVPSWLQRRVSSPIAAPSAIAAPIIQDHRHTPISPTSSTQTDCEMCGQNRFCFLQIPPEIAAMSPGSGSMANTCCKLCFWKIVEPAIRHCIGCQVLALENQSMPRPLSYEVCASIIERTLDWIDNFRPMVPEMSDDGYDTHWTACLKLLWRGQLHALRCTSRPENKGRKAINVYDENALKYASFARDSIYKTVHAIEMATIHGGFCDV